MKEVIVITGGDTRVGVVLQNFLTGQPYEVLSIDSDFKIEDVVAVIKSNQYQVSHLIHCPGELLETENWEQHFNSMTPLLLLTTALHQQLCYKDNACVLFVRSRFGDIAKAYATVEERAFNVLIQHLKVESKTMNIQVQVEPVLFGSVQTSLFSSFWRQAIHSKQMDSNSSLSLERVVNLLRQFFLNAEKTWDGHSGHESNDSSDSMRLSLQSKL